MKPSLLGCTREQIADFLRRHGDVPAFRVTQILDWVWKKRVTDFEQMSNLPPALRDELAGNFCLRPLEVQEMHHSQSGSHTRKFLSRLTDGELVESVIIPAAVGRGGAHSDRITLCVSSQVGCAFGCRFCASGMLGFRRNLSTAEIIGQILAAQDLTPGRIDNLVFMGMGEPLANTDQLLPALRLITDPSLLGIGARHITVSTSGHVPGLRLLASCGVPVRLAVSLHGASDEVRSQIMPVNRKWSLAQLLPALEQWNRTTKHMITLEYILISGVNDSLDQAELLASLAHRLNAKVNLIPYNTVQGLPWTRPSEAHCRDFCHRLLIHKIPVTMRYEKGHDINAACGQLRLRRSTEQHDE